MWILRSMPRHRRRARSGRLRSLRLRPPAPRHGDLVSGHVSRLRLLQAAIVRHALKPNRHAWVQVAEGEVTLNGRTLRAGDGAALSEESTLTLTAKAPAQALMFDL